METTTPVLAVGERCWARDASGVEHAGTIEYGPARDRDGIRGKFVKYWVVFDHVPDRPVPWPAEDVRPC